MSTQLHSSPDVSAPAKPRRAPNPRLPMERSKQGGASLRQGGASKLRIRISAYEHKILDQSIRQILDTAIRHDALLQGPIPLPTEIKKYTVNRSSFIDKNSREQFEMRVHKRLVDIVNPTPKIIEALTNLNLPSGVNVDVKMM